MNWSTFLAHQLDMRKQQALWRQRQIIKKNDARTLIFDQQQYVNFSSNDYLGLSQHSAIIKAWQIGLSQYGAGSGSSGHVIGYRCAHAQLERQLADWLGYSRALLFISGYAVNQSVIMALMNKNDHIVADKLSHASILEAAMMSPATLQRFAHNQSDALQQLLAVKHTGKTLVATEGVFSMDGDSAPLGQLQAVARQAQAWLLVDDAHGIGVSGDEGRGSCYLHKVKPELLVVTFGKAFGLSGAALLCDEITADYFLQYGRHLIYSTSMPPAQAVALAEAVRQIRQADESRANLQRNIDYFRQLANHYNLPLLNSPSAIQPLIIGSNQRCLHLSQFLRQRGFWVQAIRPPTVPPGSARLRITLTANHQLADIAQLMEALNEFFNNHADK
ncbi:8-amino-7-oxononanoate synthase [Arsenophonus nasoniae]|uniref:8-amino-7-oxononanoate synthase n=2 Tax=Arsenophonus nasoniae TaxID=638 RepID=A0A4P7KZB7_9GAMM|nr:8-amino-7-oxononanoate synthase [Arsenophonus nasoniae]QBY42994.1 8-amino-7-oxononanoate synthase [Arsenophonus nasoniae]WGM07035.1 8-amino-7-oxononanoate synthase [Arsenophonus nasoniae]WGM11915.1 8-amino-7-oxononanoate synthase [Arsenophonus nasoniae]WGM16600.1 8-amino-7-oxononanoate synthase [Arsenophonus nasoniae]